MKDKKTTDELLEEFDKIFTEEVSASVERPQRSRGYEKESVRDAKAFNKLFQRDLKSQKKVQG